MAPQGDIWSIIRSVLHEDFHFGEIKAILGHGGIDLIRLSHLEQTSGSGGATKSQLLSAVDFQIAEMYEDRRQHFLPIVIEEMVRRKPEMESRLRESLERLGWTLFNGSIIELSIFDISELPDLPPDSHTDLLKAATRLRDGDLSGAISSACAAVDSVTSHIYHELNIGDPGNASFQEKVHRVIIAKGVLEGIERELIELGWQSNDARIFKENLKGALNQGAFIMQTLRSRMGDVHGTRPVMKQLVFDSIKWASLIVNLIA